MNNKKPKEFKKYKEAEKLDKNNPSNLLNDYIKKLQNPEARKQLEAIKENLLLTLPEDISPKATRGLTEVRKTLLLEVDKIKERTDKERTEIKRKEDEEVASHFKKLEIEKKNDNDKGYKKWLEEFKIGDEVIKRYIKQETIDDLSNSNFFANFYKNDYLFGEPGKGMPGILSRKEFNPREREEFISRFFNKVIEIEANKLASIYKVDKEDIRQEFEIELIKKRGTYNMKNGLTLLSYYKLLMRHKIVDLMRSKFYAGGKYIDKEINLVDELTNNSTILSPIDNIDLKLAVSGLPVKEKKVINMIYFNDMLQEEVAKQLKMSQQNISKIRDRALKELKLILSGSSKKP